jgi:hypothetical protein
MAHYNKSFNQSEMAWQVGWWDAFGEICKNNGPNSTNYLNWRHQSFCHRYNLIRQLWSPRTQNSKHFSRPLWCFSCTHTRHRHRRTTFSQHPRQQICGRRNWHSHTQQHHHKNIFRSRFNNVFPAGYCMWKESIPTQTTGKYWGGRARSDTVREGVRWGRASKAPGENLQLNDRSRGKITYTYKTHFQFDGT